MQETLSGTAPTAKPDGLSFANELEGAATRRRRQRPGINRLHAYYAKYRCNSPDRSGLPKVIKKQHKSECDAETCLPLAAVAARIAMPVPLPGSSQVCQSTPTNVSLAEGYQWLSSQRRVGGIIGPPRIKSVCRSLMASSPCTHGLAHSLIAGFSQW